MWLDDGPERYNLLFKEVSRFGNSVPGSTWANVFGGATQSSTSGADCDPDQRRGPAASTNQNGPKVSQQHKTL